MGPTRRAPVAVRPCDRGRRARVGTARWIRRYDLETGTAEMHTFPEGREPGEAEYIARHRTAFAQ
jgi:hypothetical protein